MTEIHLISGANEKEEFEVWVALIIPTFPGFSVLDVGECHVLLG
jgi:hypothetical protein